jgi:L-arabinokinase
MSDWFMEHPAEVQWRSFADRVREEYTAFFDGIGMIVGARAPGRLDVMGGIADYSGSTVLEGTLADATFVALQARSDPVLRIRSLPAENESLTPEITVPLSALFDGETPRSHEEVNAYFQQSSDRKWAGYVAGCLYVLVVSRWLAGEMAVGMNILIDSSVPLSSGVSSSAALEVASMFALCGHYNLHLDGLEIARLCQMVENRVVGAPCGIMDQVTSVLGQENALLVLKCQPYEIKGHQPVPEGWRFVGINSHVKHSVGGHKYTRARVGAFMGLKILQTLTERDWDGYLCNVSPEAWRPWREQIPETMTGQEFLGIYQSLPDTVTSVNPLETYRVRSCMEHPILENDRVRQYIALLQLATGETDEQLLKEVGQLMLESHDSYSHRVDLGCKETDLLVILAMEQGPERGIYGAKITGGGAGGTVAVLCAGPHADAALQEIMQTYESRTGIRPGLLTGSSPGAQSFGVRSI